MVRVQAFAAVTVWALGLKVLSVASFQRLLPVRWHRAVPSECKRWVHSLKTDLTARYEGGDTNYMTMTVDGTISDSDMNLKADGVVGEGVGYISQPFPNPANDWQLEVVTTDFSSAVYGDIKRTSCVTSSECEANESCQVGCKSSTSVPGVKSVR